MKVGDKKTINIPAENAYGEKNPEMLIEYPKAQFPEDIELEVGTQLDDEQCIRSAIPGKNCGDKR